MPDPVNNLTQEGGDRYAARRSMIAVIAASLAEAPDDEIREAFHMADWRAVSPEKRARYAAHFAPLVHDAINEGLRQALASGRLNLPGFGVFEYGRGRGELFPVQVAGIPCQRAQMIRETVTFEESLGNYEGAPIVGPIAQGGFSGFYAWGDFDVSPVGVFDVSAGIKSEATFEKSRPDGSVDLWVVNALDRVAVIGRCHIDRAQSPAVSWLEVLDGDLGEGAIQGKLTPGDFRKAAAGRLDRARFFQLYDGWPNVESFADAAYWGNEWAGPVGLWAEGFPRERWVEKVPAAVGGGYQYREIEWLTRAGWMERYGQSIEAFRAAGCIVPGDLAGDGAQPLRVYAKFDRAFIDDLNTDTPGY